MITLESEHASPLAAPIDMLEHYFGHNGWASERHGDEEIVTTIEGAWGAYELRALWREDESMLQFVAMPDLQAPDDRRAAAYEIIGRINEQLWMGHFEMWTADGTLLYRHATLVDASGEGGLSLDQAETLVESAIEECDRYYPAFQFALTSDKNPADALAAALIDTAGEA